MTVESSGSAWELLPSTHVREGPLNVKWGLKPDNDSRHEVSWADHELKGKQSSPPVSRLRGCECETLEQFATLPSMEGGLEDFVSHRRLSQELRWIQVSTSPVKTICPWWMVITLTKGDGWSSRRGDRQERHILQRAPRISLEGNWPTLGCNIKDSETQLGWIST